ncbi:GDP-mannose-dependent alpha-(1-6)-phosphatidylinositol monomannoside mannosyltransferase [bacterium BMS3Abin06]|nr:GDP-mannose-dependent alpha-(1-6)-phosphatidylinositol monomannoside mannosyltransferase [bacterium BMS3Abin06]
MVVEYANHLTSQGHDAVILTNIVDTIFDVRTRIEKISGSTTKTGTIINALFKKRDYDVIVADIIMMNFFLSFRNRKKLLCFAQDYDESYYKGFFMKMLIRAVYFYCLRILKIPVIAVSDELGELLRKRFNADVSVVRNGIDTDVFYPDRDEKYRSLKSNSKVILVFARSDYRKGFDIAIQVLSNFRNDIDNGNISVWAIGEDIDVPFKIRKFGFVPPDELRRILSCSDVLLYPSRHEGLPLFVLEAMACGCPVVTTKAVKFVKNHTDALQSKVEDVKSLVDLVATLINNENIGSKIMQEAFETVKRFNIKHSMNMFENDLSTKTEKN